MSGKDAASLRALAQQCNCLARGVTTPGAAASLREMAADYERQAERAAARESQAAAAPPPAPRPIAESAG